MKFRPSLPGISAALLASAWFAVAGSAGASDYANVEVGPKFTASGELLFPEGFRRWVFIGSPLTPHGLNNNAAGFPEFHNVYVEPAALDYYMRTGVWPEGAMMVKELQLSQEGTFPDGSRVEQSGRGYFPGTPNGLDVSVKDSKRFTETRGWGFFNFGHKAPPYPAKAARAGLEECAACHIASAHEDMVFTGFYQHLLAPMPEK
ncbi:MAG: cytochrome P460 family protein [Gammaproteobacteria bacterium]|nr:cytochrome P460 family protein [Gammaproteobacteria bacterium]